MKVPTTERGTAMIPDFLPVLSKGGHISPAEGACFMEWASILAGEEFTDSPKCSHPVLTRLAQSVNDRLPDDQRHRIAHLIPSVIGTAHPEPGSLDDRRLSVRLAVWAARQVVHLAPNPAAAEKAIAAAEAWADDPTEQNRKAAAAAAAAHAASYAAHAASYAAAAAAAAASAAYAASYAAAAHAATAADGLIALLEGAIQEHARLTGHNGNDVDATRWETARELVAR